MPDNLFQFVDSNPNSVIAPMPDMLPVFAQQVQKQNQDYDTGQQEYNAYQDNINKSKPLDNTQGSKGIFDKLNGVWNNVNEATKNVATGNMDFGNFRYRIPKFSNDIGKYSSALQSNNAAMAEAKKTAYDPNNKNQFSEQEYLSKLNAYNSGNGLTEDQTTGDITGYFDSSIRTKAVVDPKDFVDNTVKLLSSQSLGPMFYAPGTYNTDHPIMLTQDQNGNLIDSTGKQYDSYDTVMQAGPNFKNVIGTTVPTQNADGTISYITKTKDGGSYISHGKSESYITNAIIAGYVSSPEAQDSGNYLSKIGYYNNPNGFLQVAVDYGKTKVYNNTLITTEQQNDMTGKGGSGSGKTPLPTGYNVYTGGNNINLTSYDPSNNNLGDTASSIIQSKQNLNKWGVFQADKNGEFIIDPSTNLPTLSDGFSYDQNGNITYNGNNPHIDASVVKNINDHYNNLQQSGRKISNAINTTNSVMYNLMVDLIGNKNNGELIEAEKAKLASIIRDNISDPSELRSKIISELSSATNGGLSASQIGEKYDLAIENNNNLSSNGLNIAISTTPKTLDLRTGLASVLTPLLNDNSVNYSKQGSNKYDPITQANSTDIANIVALSKTGNWAIGANGTVTLSGTNKKGEGLPTYTIDFSKNSNATQNFLSIASSNDPELGNKMQSYNWITDNFRSGNLNIGTPTTFSGNLILNGKDKGTQRIEVTPLPFSNKDDEMSFSVRIVDEKGNDILGSDGKKLIPGKAIDKDDLWDILSQFKGLHNDSKATYYDESELKRFIGHSTSANNTRDFTNALGSGVGF